MPKSILDKDNKTSVRKKQMLKFVFSQPIGLKRVSSKDDAETSADSPTKE